MNDKPIIGRYARIIMDDWFKRTFGTEPNKGLLIMLLKELIPEHDIKDLTYVQQEHINPFPGKKDALIDAGGTAEILLRAVAFLFHFRDSAAGGEEQLDGLWIPAGIFRRFYGFFPS